MKPDREKWCLDSAWVNQGNDLRMLKQLFDKLVEVTDPLSLSNEIRPLLAPYDFPHTEDSLFPELIDYGLSLHGTTPGYVAAAYEVILSQLAVTNQLNRFQMEAIDLGVTQAFEKETNRNNDQAPLQKRIDSLQALLQRATKFPKRHQEFIEHYHSTIQAGVPISPFIINYAEDLDRLFLRLGLRLSRYDDRSLLLALNSHIRVPGNHAQRIFQLTCEAVELVRHECAGFEVLFEHNSETPVEEYVAAFKEIGMHTIAQILNRVSDLIPAELRCPENNQSLQKLLSNNYKDFALQNYEFSKACLSFTPTVARYVRSHWGDFQNITL